MKRNQQIEIPINKGRIGFALFLSTLFLIVAIRAFVKPPNPILALQILRYIVATTGLIFVGFAVIYFFQKLLDNKPGLIVNDKGIFDNTNAMAVGQILWQDIQKIKLKSFLNNLYLICIVKNPEEYINRQTNWLKRKSMQMNYKYFGWSPVTILTKSLICEEGELYTMLQDWFRDSQV